MHISKTLKKLLSEHKLNTMELARRTGIGQPVIYRLMSGETDNPKIVTLCALASYFGITVNQLIGETPLCIGQGKQSKSSKKMSEIPIINWDEVADYKTKHSVNSEVAFANVSFNSRIYALKMDDNSMTPIFSKGTIIIIDGNKIPKDRSYAVIKLKEQKKAVFRQVLIDGNYQYLKPLNPDIDKYKMKLFSRGDKYYGVLIQAQKDYNS